VVGYNAYRRAGEGGSFVKIADKVPAPPYENVLVNSGRTYFYVVTTVDQVGRESRFSAETKAKIP
jgi:fibronectin type 3 domain-containing protein